MPIPSASGRCEGEGFPPSRLDFDRERASLRDVLRDDNLNPAPGIGAIREHKAIERLAVHSQVYRTLEAKPMTAKAQTERRSNAVVRQPKSDLSRRQPPIEFDDLDPSVWESGWALHLTLYSNQRPMGLESSVMRTPIQPLTLLVVAVAGWLQRDQQAAMVSLLFN